MLTIYYTRQDSGCNKYGHRTSKGACYVVQNGELMPIGVYMHRSGSAGIERAVLETAEKAGLLPTGSYYSQYRDVARLIEL